MGIYKISTIGEIIKDNSYVGRGIIIGKSRNGEKAVTAYFIMGRSENSRNRVFIKQGDEVIIHPFDASKVEDPSLIIYSPVRAVKNSLIVTNGDQTDTIYDFINDGKTFEQALETREFEPDKPNFTPRISGILNFNDNEFDYKLSILKSADENGSACNRYTFNYSPLNGLGHFIHTYNCDGSPIPTFTGEPERVEIPDDIDEFTDDIWNNLNEQNKISLYVRYIDLESGEYCDRMINKNK
ncbi:MAG: IMP cyclohydrolase [Clostridiaceae bacterium]|nr:IMP cyclohydrolase [Clostridiaceae bacterium]